MQSTIRFPNSDLESSQINHDCIFTIIYENMTVIGRTSLGRGTSYKPSKNALNEIKSKINREGIDPDSITDINVYLYRGENTHDDNILCVDGRFLNAYADNQVLVAGKFGRVHQEHFRDISKTEFNQRALQYGLEPPLKIKFTTSTETDSDSNSDSDPDFEMDDIDQDNPDDPNYEPEYNSDSGYGSGYYPGYDSDF